MRAVKASKGRGGAQCEGVARTTRQDGKGLGKLGQHSWRSGRERKIPVDYGVTKEVRGSSFTLAGHTPNLDRADPVSRQIFFLYDYPSRFNAALGRANEPERNRGFYEGDAHAQSRVQGQYAVGSI